jgi:uncharacterized protein YydD (DUF2326 family)
MSNNSKKGNNSKKEMPATNDVVETQETAATNEVVETQKMAATNEVIETQETAVETQFDAATMAAAMMDVLNGIKSDIAELRELVVQAQQTPPAPEAPVRVDKIYRPMPKTAAKKRK